MAVLYSAISSGVYDSAVVEAADDISGGLEDAAAAGDLVAEFDGNAGYEVPDSDTNDSPVTMSGSAGTVQAWVYAIEHTTSAGIVHKGVETDFSDESYSLQFNGKRGNVSFAIVAQNPYKYSFAKSQLRLNTGKWYFVAGTYDQDNVKVYIFGDGVSSGGNNFYVKSATNKIGDPLTPGGPLIIGSQFTEAQRKNGYYGFNGLINGVVVDNENALTAAELETYYDANKAKVTEWGPN